MGALIATLISLAPKLIVPAIRAVEALFGPKTGEVKMEAVIAALMPLLEKAAAAGKIPGIPDEHTLRTVVEAVFQRDKQDTAADFPSRNHAANCLQIPPGSTITVQVPPDIKADILVVP